MLEKDPRPGTSPRAFGISRYASSTRGFPGQAGASVEAVRFIDLTGFSHRLGNDRCLRILFSNGSYVDGPLASVFISAVNGWRPSVICPACWRGLGPLALMKSDDPRLPIKGASSGLLTHCGVCDGLRSSRRVVHHVVVALAKLLSLRSPFECVAPDWD